MAHPGSNGADPVALVADVAAIGRLLNVSEDLDETLSGMVRTARSVLPGCDTASISILQPDGSLTTAASTDRRAVNGDELQYKLQEGPCVDAATKGTDAYADDLRTTTRWPNYGPVAADLGFASLLSCRLLMGATGRPVGALNLYSTRTAAYPPPVQDVATLVAGFAGVLVAASMHHASLREAIESRDVIGQAKGILMERHRISADDAFDILRRSSQHLNRKLRDIAQDLASTGQLPGGDASANRE